MSPSLTLAQIARIEELLTRLDPDPAPVCQVPGCLHLHTGSTAREGLPALAA
jgi:hypothetical protein